MYVVLPTISFGQTLIVRYQFLTAVSMKMIPFWDIVPCSLVEVVDAYCLHHQDYDDGGRKHL
jgi:hypothetical protein